MFSRRQCLTGSIHFVGKVVQQLEVVSTLQSSSWEKKMTLVFEIIKKREPLKALVQKTARTEISYKNVLVYFDKNTLTAL